MSTESNVGQSRPRWPLIAFLALYTLVVRLVPYALSRFGFPLDADITVYPWNFSPLLAVCLFGGASFTRPSLALGLPVLLTFAGDAAIYGLTGRANLVSIPISLTVSLSAAGCSILGFRLRNGRTWLRTMGAGLAGCAIFFLVTNFASWLCYDSFPRTPLGLLECYAAGLPFFGNTLISTAFFGGLLFSRTGVREPNGILVATAART